MQNVSIQVGNDDYAYKREYVPVLLSGQQEDLEAAASELRERVELPFEADTDKAVMPDQNTAGLFMYVSLNQMNSGEVLKRIEAAGFRVIENDELLAPGEEEENNGRPISQWDGER